MAKQVKLKAERRAEIGRAAARRLKARGVVPAIIYGAKEKPQPLQLSLRDINAMLSHASGENILVELEIDGEKSKRTALVQEVQHSPVGGDVLHVDFHAISMDETIQADVPLEALGVANGVKNFGGLLEQNLRVLSIECLPRDLPDRITVDVSALNIGDSIHVRDIKLPTGVTAKVQPELTAFSVVAPVVEEEPVVAEAEAAAGPEVIKEKKEEGEAAAPVPGAKGVPVAKGAPVAAKGAAGAPAPKEKEQKK
jgi:large subunit ribosomal protein L25